MDTYLDARVQYLADRKEQELESRIGTTKWQYSGLSPNCMIAGHPLETTVWG